MSSDLDRITDELKRFTDEIAISNAESIDLIMERYITFRRTLSRHFRELAERKLCTGPTILDDVSNRIETALKAVSNSRLPEKYLAVRGYSQTHKVLLQYLARHLAKPVAASKLRILTGDQIHTERRVRELRDLGLNISWSRRSEEDQYLLGDLRIDLPGAVRCQLDKSIRADRTISDRQKAAYLAEVPTYVDAVSGK